MTDGKKNILFVIGVSGTGKSTIGKLLAEKLNLAFYDGDDFHSASNIEKMANKNPLTDEDRHDWLLTLNQLAIDNKEKGAVIVCSALKESYRKLLQSKIEDKVIWISLEGSFELLLDRLQKRKDHFMPADLLRSQLDTFEPPSRAIKISIEPSPEEIIDIILREYTKAVRN
ncbi:gluconokinase [Arenibacter sp. BSSL-BM3]|uniref:Gluconokinase n=1 Tax=Arenibacter arenosicollis TaxID=2762274 RepID=A0ABR7QQJ9_9FLAO|nr:gluconokinase [Arenibacter arenosicollis]MBC8769471.1 gluconokinase [Arenibacter arenosicollis]